MSVTLPVCAIVFGSVTPPQGDVLDLRVHLGCTKEVSSFDCLLQNFDKKYSPGGTYPINVGDDGSISVGRGANCPLILTLRVEEIEPMSSPVENYIRVKGRCWGEKIFRRVVTKTYENQKGEDIVKDLIDYYVGLSHVRDLTELIEDTDTTYTLLEYENSPVFDIVKYIAESADLAGVIGYDFRVEPDGKFAFFPKNSKTSPVSLAEKIEYSRYSKDIHRIRNRIFVQGAAEKATPLDKDADTEDLTKTDGPVDAPDGQWISGTGCGNVYVETSVDHVIVGSKSLEHRTESLDYWGCAVFIYAAGKEVDANKFPSLTFQIKLQKDKNFAGSIKVELEDSAGSKVWKEIAATPDKWSLQSFAAGKKNSDQWTHSVFNAQPFNWGSIKKIFFYAYFGSGSGTGSFWIDNFFFNHCRWEARRPLEEEEPTSSQTAYGVRELVEVDEELHSDNECDLRAKALLAHLENPAEYITVRSTVIDYGTDPILAGDKIHVVLPNENIDSDFRVISVEYHVIAAEQTLEITLELGKEKPLLADYLYGLRSTTITVEKLMRTKSGLRGIVGSGGGGGGGGIPDWLSPTYIGPRSDTPAITNFRTKNIDGDTPVDHQFNPTDDEHGVFGAETKRWKEAHIKYLFVTSYGRLAQLNIGDYGGDQVVITPARVLQNVFADAAIITSGQFLLARMPRGDVGKFLRAYGAEYDPMYASLVVADIPDLPASKITSGKFLLARLPEGTGGYVLEAQGAGFDPMYVDPNYRYEPKSHPHSEHTGIGANDHHAQVHNHAGESISPNAVSCNAMSIAASCNRQYTHPSGQQCVYASSVAWENCPRFYCVNYSAGDLCIKNGMRIPFINGMVITEAEKLGLGKGLAFLNDKGKVLMTLDEKGNLSIAGKIKQGLEQKVN